MAAGLFALDISTVTSFSGGRSRYIPMVLSISPGKSLLIALGGSVALLWMTATAWTFGKSKRLDNRLTILLAFGFLAGFIWYAVPRALFIVQSWPRPALIEALFTGRAAGLFAIASYATLTYKATLALEHRRPHVRPSVARRFGNWLAFAVYPIGLWWVQPAIREALTAQPEQRPLEDHLLQG